MSRGLGNPPENQIVISVHVDVSGDTLTAEAPVRIGALYQLEACLPHGEGQAPHKGQKSVQEMPLLTADEVALPQVVNAQVG